MITSQILENRVTFSLQRIVNYRAIYEEGKKIHVGMVTEPTEIISRIIRYDKTDEVYRRSERFLRVNEPVAIIERYSLLSRFPHDIPNIGYLLRLPNEKMEVTLERFVKKDFGIEDHHLAEGFKIEVAQFGESKNEHEKFPVRVIEIREALFQMFENEKLQWKGYTGRAQGF